MDQDIKFQVPATVASSAANAYFAVPYRCTLRNVRAIPQAAMAAAGSSAVTVTSGSTSMGAVAFTVDSSSAAAVGVPGTYTPDASAGSTVLAAGSVIKFAVSAPQNLLLDIELDPYARSL